jgi:ABC-type dipeptide/oligopeptide/nickel transport system permease subunit
MQTGIINVMNDFYNFWIYCSSFVIFLVVLSWVLVREKLRNRMSQRRYSALLISLSAVISTLVMILPLGIIAVTNPSDFETVIQQLASEFQFYGGLLLLYILIATIAGWQFAKLYPLNEESNNQS